MQEYVVELKNKQDYRILQQRTTIAVLDIFTVINKEQGRDGTMKALECEVQHELQSIAAVHTVCD